MELDEQVYSINSLPHSVQRRGHPMNFSVERARTFGRAIFLASTLIPLSGCVAAAPAIMLAASAATTGFFGYKMFQTASGTEVGVELPSERLDPSAAELVRNADTLAFWASPDRTLVVAAERAEGSGRFSRVVSPARGATLIRELNLATDVGVMTSSERQRSFAQFAERADADLVIAIHELGAETAANTFSLSRARMTVHTQVFMFSRTAGREVWTTNLDLVVGMGNNMPSETELEDVIGRAIADRLNDIADGTAARDIALRAVPTPYTCTTAEQAGCVR